MIGLNSLWGMIYQVRKEISLSRREVLWVESWVNISMMVADAPRYLGFKKEDESKSLTDNELKDQLSNL